MVFVENSMFPVAKGDEYSSLGCAPAGRNPRLGGKQMTLPEGEQPIGVELFVPFWHDEVPVLW